MIGSLYNGISGIVNYSNSLNVSANNISNANTVGHKADVITFEDMMYQNSEYGKGVSTQSVEKSFLQGNLKDTGVNYDFAIQGDGFFVVQDTLNDKTYYTRAGNFTESKDGILQNQDGLNVQGSQTQVLNATSSNEKTEFDDSFNQFLATKIVSTDSEVISINAKSTDYTKTVQGIGESGNNLKLANSLISDINLLKTNYNEKLELLSSNPTLQSVSSTNQVSTLEYQNIENSLNNSNSFVSLSIGDTILKQNFTTDTTTTMNNFADKISNELHGLNASYDSDSKILTINNLIPGKNTPISTFSDSQNAPILTTVEAIEGSGFAMIESARDALKNGIELAGGEFLDIQNGIIIADSDTLILGDINLQLSELGISDNDDITFEATSDGVLILKQGSNSYVAGRISTAQFRDPTELNPESDNLYSESLKSGTPKNADLINEVVANNLELSNVSLSESLSKLIVSQRAFEANSKSITTSDEFLKTAIQLKNS